MVLDWYQLMLCIQIMRYELQADSLINTVKCSESVHKAGVLIYHFNPRKTDEATYKAG